MSRLHASFDVVASKLTFLQDLLRSDEEKGLFWEKLNDLVLNGGIESNLVIKLISTFPDWNWNWCKATHFALSDPDVIIALPSKPWNWKVVTRCMAPTRLLGLGQIVPSLDFDVLSTIAPLQCVAEHPEYPWDWLRLSTRRPPWDLVLDLCDMKWCWELLSTREDLDLALVKRLPGKHWDWECVAMRMCQTIRTPERFLDIVQDGDAEFCRRLSWCVFLKHASREIHAFLADCADLLAVWVEGGCSAAISCAFSSNPVVDLAYVFDRGNFQQCWLWCWDTLSMKPCTDDDWERVVEHARDCPWNWDVMSRVPGIPLTVVEAIPGVAWNWKCLSHQFVNNDGECTKFLDAFGAAVYSQRFDHHVMSRVCPLQTIVDHPDIDWDWVAVSSRVNSLDIVLKLSDKRWDWGGELTERAVYEQRFDVVRSLAEKPWNWSQLSLDVDIEFVLGNPGLPWDFDRVSENALLTWDHVKSLPDAPWNACKLIDLALIVADDELAVSYKRKRACRVIQRQWRNCWYDRRYRLCNKRLMAEYNVMQYELRA